MYGLGEKCTKIFIPIREDVRKWGEMYEFLDTYFIELGSDLRIREQM